MHGTLELGRVATAALSGAAEGKETSQSRGQPPLQLLAFATLVNIVAARQTENGSASYDFSIRATTLLWCCAMAAEFQEWEGLSSRHHTTILLSLPLPSCVIGPHCIRFCSALGQEQSGPALSAGVLALRPSTLHIH